MTILNDLINLIYIFIEIIKSYWIFVFLFFIILFFFKLKKNYKNSDNFLTNKTGYIVVDGKFETGKTRFLTQLSKDSKKRGRFVLSNFYNGYNFIKWNSLEDFMLLLTDVWTLGEYQNFSDDEIIKIYGDNKKELQEKIKIRKEIRKKFENIPGNGFFNSFLINADEFQNYFFNRNSMSNFSGDNKKMLKLLHQVRHFNSMVIIGTQDSDELDVKFRRLSSFYINTIEIFNGFLYGYNVFSYTTDKEKNINLEIAKKFTKIPVLKINFYKLNGIFEQYIYFANKLNKYHKYFFGYLKEREIKYRFSQLDFFTKYNVNPDISTYKKFDLFKKINDFYIDENHFYKTNKN